MYLFVRTTIIIISTNTAVQCSKPYLRPNNIVPKIVNVTFLSFAKTAQCRDVWVSLSPRYITILCDNAVSHNPVRIKIEPKITFDMSRSGIPLMKTGCTVLSHEFESGV